MFIVWIDTIPLGYVYSVLVNDTTYLHWVALIDDRSEVPSF